MNKIILLLLPISFLNSSSKKPALMPAPFSKVIVQPNARYFLTVSGVAATRFSPIAVSNGIKIRGKSNKSSIEMEITGSRNPFQELS